MLSLSMASTDGSFEPQKPSARKKMTIPLTLFDGVIDSSKTKNLHYDNGNLENPYQKELSPADCESGISGSDNDRRSPFSDKGTSRHHQWKEIQEVIKRKFAMSLGSCGYNARVESIQRKHYSADAMSRAKFLSFNLYSDAMKVKRGGNPNLRYAWLGASKNEVHRIFSQRFALPMNTGEYGQGVYLSPVNNPVESMHSSPPDEDGLRHMILCRVILGNMEVVRPGTGQYNPSSEKFDSGIDDLFSPKKYIIWNGDMNTHILPEFVVSFRTCIGREKGSEIQKISQPLKLPNSNWMSIEALAKELTKFLPADDIRSIAKVHSEFKKQKISRHEMIRRLRNIAGDKLLISILKSSKGQR